MSVYVITDPIYLVSKSEDRRKLDSLIRQKINHKTYPDAARCLSEILDTEAYCISRTGYGNWFNFITAHEAEIKVRSTSFAADSGLMCILKATDTILKKINSNVLGNFAIFETDRAITSVSVDDSNPEWYIMSVYSDDSLLVSTDSYDIPF